MAELADAADSKSADPCGHGGSTPPPGTNKTKEYPSRKIERQNRDVTIGCFRRITRCTGEIAPLEVIFSNLGEAALSPLVRRARKTAAY